MGRYVARRLLQMIPVFIGSTLLIFCMMYALPGDPVRAMMGDQAYDPTVVASIKKELGLDQPLLQQYVNYMTGLFQGDFGTQIASQRPIADVIADAFPVTIRLTLFAFTFVTLVGIGLGVVAGLRPDTLRDRGLLTLTLVLVSMPSFVLGFLLQYLLAFQWSVTTPTVTDSTDFSQLMLPAIVLASLSLAYVARLTRTSIAENLRSDYMRTAVAKGLPRRRVIGVHLMRNSLIPVVTFLGIELGNLMTGAIVTEGIFNVRGIGIEIYDALSRREGATVVGIASLMVLIYLAASLIVDLLYAVLDPRIRYA
ncbi:ABC transporter permease [Streptomyces coeruleorubidus]|jgi:peptide/nickel transport system permease protein/oligopeptide transport system permease protein|uniref:ABC transporter permease n=1 Tax=Streptomyces coeruleorubidus TaxID=116188 RepID=A0A5J6IFJ2_STRC4|nr:MULTISPECIES: ABC transporter permease [Streptomyces]QEV27597.1 ABC transporter permease [Streptomyces coeruleorubidus]WOT34516.1 ABC transporter permease [Streptomyces coeruleorubidus]GGT69644.1 ABC transporter permease [Streptomyces coeruleorubidus]GGT88076.1 ABC transporter permease [Streptomyces bellus]